eukprot:766209-Hanusia_phi.AAC.8
MKRDESWSSPSSSLSFCSDEEKRKSKLEELDKMGDGVGSRLLRKMGWDGGGLGQREQGKLDAIEIEAKQTHTREGIGMSVNATSGRSHVLTGLREGKRRSDDASKEKTRTDFLLSESDFSDEKAAGGRFGRLRRAWDEKSAPFERASVMLTRSQVQKGLRAREAQEG